MDYAINSHLRNNNSNENVVFPGFIYDNKRFCSRLYVFLKMIGLIFYTISLINCYRLDFYIIMIVSMSLSTMNSARYEYAHLKKNGTIFSSIDEFKQWKKKLYPKSRIFFSTIELVIKIVFFAKIFPPHCEFGNLCEIGDSIFKIHILVLFIIYIIAGGFSIGLFCLIYSYENPNRQSISLPISILVIYNQNEECCICLDIGDNITWSILPCGHKFHQECILIWLRTNQTCPICRLYVS